MDNLVGKNIRRIRRDKDLTLDQLGLLSALSPITICRYEMGHRKPGEDNIRKLAKGLRVEPGELFRRRG